MSEEFAKGVGATIGFIIGAAINIALIVGICYLVVRYCF